MERSLGTTRRNPTVEVASVATLLSLVGFLGETIGLGPAVFALALPLETQPWTLVTSVYAHGSITHLVVNLLALLVAGLLIQRRTTWLRFHGFVLVTGMLSGVATVGLGLLLGRPVAVLGLSGAILALYGYLLAGNVLTNLVVGRLSLSRRTWIPIALGVALVVTVATGGQNVAYTAHLTGFLLGLIAGRGRLLRA